MAAKHKCTHCKDYFPRDEMLKTPAGKFCTSEHLLEYSRKPESVERGRKLKHQERKRNYLPLQIENTRKKFNTFILLLDQRRGCISCGSMAGPFHAGHFKSVGSAPHLRFLPMNVHKQCAGCNLKVKHRKSFEATMEQDYRRALALRLPGAVEYLDSEAGPWQPTPDMLETLRGLVAEETKRIKDGHPLEIDWRALTLQDLSELLTTC